MIKNVMVDLVFRTFCNNNTLLSRNILAFYQNLLFYFLEKKNILNIRFNCAFSFVKNLKQDL